MAANTLIEGGTVLAGEAWIPEGHVVAQDGDIVAVGPGSAPVRADTVIDASDTLVIPGLVNAHSHLYMSLGRGLGHDRPLRDWLAVQMPLTAAFEPEDYRLAAQLGALENLWAGVTSVAESFYSAQYDDGVDQIAMAALVESGIRGGFFRNSNDLPLRGWAESLTDMTRRTAELQAAARGSLIEVGAGPVTPIAASMDYWCAAAEQLADGVRMHLHTSETDEYDAATQALHGRTNLQLLAEIGMLTPLTMLVHCVHASDDDLRQIAASGAHIVLNPVSNMFLASGVAPVTGMLAHGCSLSLGSDAASCSGGQDVLEGIKMAVLLQRVTQRDASAISTRDVIRMATEGGAAAIGLPGRVGRIAVGHAADITLLPTDNPRMAPMHDPEAALAFFSRTADVDTVLVDGEILLRHGRATRLDEEELVAKAHERGMALVRKADL